MALGVPRAGDRCVQGGWGESWKQGPPLKAGVGRAGRAGEAAHLEAWGRVDASPREGRERREGGSRAPSQVGRKGSAGLPRSQPPGALSLLLDGPLPSLGQSWFPDHRAPGSAPVFPSQLPPSLSLSGSGHAQSPRSSDPAAVCPGTAGTSRRSCRGLQPARDSNPEPVPADHLALLSHSPTPYPQSSSCSPGLGPKAPGRIQKGCGGSQELPPRQKEQGRQAQGQRPQEGGQRTVGLRAPTWRAPTQPGEEAAVHLYPGK